MAAARHGGQHDRQRRQRLQAVGEGERLVAAVAEDHRGDRHRQARRQRSAPPRRAAAASAAPPRRPPRAAVPATGLAPPQSRLNSTASDTASQRGTRVVVNRVIAISPQASPQAKVIRPSTTLATWVTAAAIPPSTGRAGLQPVQQPGGVPGADHRGQRAGDLGAEVGHQRRGPQGVAVLDGAAEPPEVDDRDRVPAGEVGPGQLRGQVGVHRRQQQETPGQQDGEPGGDQGGPVAGVPQPAAEGDRTPVTGAAPRPPRRWARTSQAHRAVSHPQRTEILHSCPASRSPAVPAA